MRLKYCCDCTCFSTHNSDNCPRYKKNFLKSYRKGNYSAYFTNCSHINQVKEHVASEDNFTSKSEFFICVIYNENVNTVYNPEKLGAQVNARSEAGYNKFKQKLNLKPSKIKLTVYNGNEMPLLGEFKGNVTTASRI